MQFLTVRTSVKLAMDTYDESRLLGLVKTDFARITLFKGKEKGSHIAAASSTLSTQKLRNQLEN